MNKDI